jgi:hypothetical protein
LTSPTQSILKSTGSAMPDGTFGDDLTGLALTALPDCPTAMTSPKSRTRRPWVSLHALA